LRKICPRKKWTPKSGANIGAITGILLRFKFKKAGIHDTTTLMSILSNLTDVDAMKALKLKFNAVGLKGINTSTVKILREENDRNRQHWEHNNHRYHTMEMEIGVNAMM
jgi:hypothetical protein